MHRYNYKQDNVSELGVPKVFDILTMKQEQFKREGKGSMRNKSKMLTDSDVNLFLHKV